MMVPASSKITQSLLLILSGWTRTRSFESFLRKKPTASSSYAPQWPRLITSPQAEGFGTRDRRSNFEVRPCRISIANGTPVEPAPALVNRQEGHGQIFLFPSPRHDFTVVPSPLARRDPQPPMRNSIGVSVRSNNINSRTAPPLPIPGHCRVQCLCPVNYVSQRCAFASASVADR